MNRTARFALAGLVLLVVGFIGGIAVNSSFNKRLQDDEHVRTVFTPWESGIDNYLAFLDKTKVSVHAAFYSFTDPLIVDKLIELMRDRKVKVHLLLDASQTRGRSGKYEQEAIEKLRKAGAEVIIGTSPKKHAIMHNKFTVRDEVELEDGSWNGSHSANDQCNVLNFDKYQPRVAAFLERWHTMHDFMKTQDQAIASGDSGDSDDDDEPDTKPAKKQPAKKTRATK